MAAPGADDPFADLIPSAPGPSDGLHVTGKAKTQGTGQIDPRLLHILEEAAKDSPYQVEMFSGYRPGDPRFHGQHLAADIRLVDRESGQALPDYQDEGSFRAYEAFAQRARETQQRLYPDLEKTFRWGGYFSGGRGKYGALDQMHFDLGGSEGLGMAGGSWDEGLTQDQRRRFPKAQSQGMARPASPAGRVLDFLVPPAQADESPEPASPYGPFDDLVPAPASSSAPAPRPGAVAVQPAPAAKAESDPFADLIPPSAPGALPPPLAAVAGGPSAVATGAAPSKPNIPPEELSLVVPPNLPSTTRILPHTAARDLPLPPTDQARQALADLGPLGAFVADRLPRSTLAEQQDAEKPRMRLPQKVVDDLAQQGAGFSPEEFSGVLEALRRGQLDNPDAVRGLVAARLPRAYLDAVDNAIAVHSAERETLNTPASPVADALPGGKIGLHLAGKAIDSATLGLTDVQPRLSGNVDIDRLLTASQKAESQIGRQLDERFPLASGAAELAGGVVPYVGAAKLLRGARAAAGLPEVAPGAGGAIAEGAQLGGVIEPLRRPEGAEDMMPGQNLQARALQGLVGVATGALLDFGVMKLGEYQGVVRGALADRAKRMALTEEARRAGFDDPAEYLSTLTKVERTPDGSVIRPDYSILDKLPGAESRPAHGGEDVSIVDSGTTGEPGVSAGTVPARVPGTAETQPEGVSGATEAPDRLAGEGMAPAATVSAPNEGAAKEPAAPDWRGLAAEADELERLARATENPQIRQMLLGDALARRSESEAVRARAAGPKLSPADRARRARVVQPEADDLVTAIRKLGGIDVTRETDWAGRLSHLPKTGFGLPGIEQTTGRGRTLDDLAESLHDLGYLAGRDVRELEDKLFVAETGEPVWSFTKRDFEGPAREPRRLVEPIPTAFEGAAPSDPYGMGARPASDSWLLDESEYSPAMDGRGRRMMDLADELNRHTDGLGTDTIERHAIQGADDETIIQELETALASRARAGEVAGGPETRARAETAGADGAGRDGEPAESAGPVVQRPGDFFPAKQGAGPDVPGRDVQPQPTRERSNGGQERQEDGRRRQEEVLAGGPESIPLRADSGAALQRMVDARLENIGTLYANPFLLGAADLARDVGLDVKRYPRRAAAQVALGAAAGGLGSENEPGSAKWWLDVATGGVAAKVLGTKLPGLFKAMDHLPLIGRGPEEVRALKRRQQLMRQLMDRQTAEVGKFLRENFAPSERAMMADLIETRGIVPDLNLVQRQAAELDAYLSHAGARLRQLGMLAEDQELGGYLHRYYAKHLDTLSTLNSLKAWKDKLSGSYTLARGTEDGFGREYFSPGAQGVLREFERVQADIKRLEDEARSVHPLNAGTPGFDPEQQIRPLQEEIAKHEQALRGVGRDSPDAAFLQGKIDDLRARIETLRNTPATPGKRPTRTEIPDVFGGAELDALRARRKELQAIELSEYLGQEDGKPKSYVFLRDEVPVVDVGVPPAQGLRPDYSGRPVAAADARAVAAPGRLPDVPGADGATPAGLASTDRVWTLRGVDDKTALLHRDWTEAERRAWGEIKDAGYRYVRGMAEVSHDISLATLFDTVAKRADWVSSEAREGWTEVPDSKIGGGSPLRKYGALAGKWVRPDVWAGIQGYGRSPLGNHPLVKIYRDALAKWKLWHTADNPVTHFNNLYSNAEMLFLSGYGPKDLADAIGQMRQGEASKLWREARDEGLFGTDWTASILADEGGAVRGLMDLAEDLRKQPEIPDAAVTTSKLMDLKRWWLESKEAVRGAEGPWKTGAELIRSFALPPLKAAAKPYGAYARMMRRAYSFEDNLFKMAVYLAERRRGLDSARAAERVGDYFFDYFDVPQAIRLVRDLPVGSPFISYTYLAVQAMAKNLVERPERMLALLAGYEALNYATIAASEDGAAPGQWWAMDRAEETLSGPWDRGRALAGSRNMIHLPYPEGYRLALGRAHALGNPFGNEAGGKEKNPPLPVVGELWGPAWYGGNPFLGMFVDVISNEDWKGKPIYHEADPQRVKIAKVGTYLAQAFAPSSPVVPGSYHQRKILEGLANDVADARKEGRIHMAAPVVDAANGALEALGLEQLTGLDRQENPISTRDALLGSVGIKLRPAHFDQGLDFQLGELQQQRRAAMDRLRKEQRKHGGSRITDGQMDQADADYEQAMADIQEKEDRLFKAEETLRQTGKMK